MSLLDAKTIKIAVGETREVRAKILPDGAKSQGVSWGPGNPNVIMLSGATPVKGYYCINITGQSIGITTLRVATVTSTRIVNLHHQFDSCVVRVTSSTGATLPLAGYEDGDDWDNNLEVNGSTQCDAFARFVFQKIHGVFPPYLSTLPGHPDNRESLNEENILDYLRTWGQYSYVRGFTPPNPNSQSYPDGIEHSIFVISFNTANVTFYHANFTEGKVSYEEGVPHARLLEVFKFYITHYSVT